MKPEKILYALNEIDGQFIREAHESAAASRKVSRRFVALIAAVIAMMAMTLTTFATEDIASWFKQYFARQSGTQLTTEQIRYIDENEQVMNNAQTRDGWTIKLHSAITDGTKGMIILGVTAPENVSLETLYTEDGAAYSRLNIVDDWAKPVVYPDGVEEDVITWFFMDDGDGLKNTENFIIEVQPKPGTPSRTPFDPNTQWKVVLNDIVRITDDVELLKEISNELGEYCYEGDVSTTDMLLAGNWEFVFHFRAENAQEKSREILTAPLSTMAQVYKRYGSGDGEYSYVLENVTVTSVKLNSLSATISYEFEGLYPAFEWETARIYVVMKDGSRIMLEDNWSRWDGYNVLKARSPIVLDEVVHVLLADGTKIMVP